MCMEDIKVGRRTVSSTVSRLVANNDVLNVPANGRRVGLLLSSSNCNLCWVVREIHDASSVVNALNNFGLLTFNSVNPWFLMRTEEYGIMPQLAYTLLNQDGSPRVLSYTELIPLE